MQTEILYAPAYALARLTLAPREAATVEAGAMVSMSSDMEIKTSTQGGFLKGLKRSVLGGESFFVNTFTAWRPTVRWSRWHSTGESAAK